MILHPGKISAALLWLATGFSAQTLAAACDVDNDGDVDRLDLRAIAGANNTRSDGSGDSRDADGDGTITMQDLSLCIRQCSLAGCGISDPASPAPGSTAAATGATREALDDAANPSSAMPDQAGNATQGAATAGGRQWQVRPGDTLYSIGRSLFPRDTARQARLRQDIVRLNPSVFVDGADNLTVGAVLEMPAYVGFENPAARAEQARPVTSPVTGPITSGKIPQPVDSAPLVGPLTEKPREPGADLQKLPQPALDTGVGSESAASARKSTATDNQVAANALVSLGYSLGGDKLVDGDGSTDLHAGAGAHLRLGFEQMPRHGGGYRVALGLQYNLLQEGGENSTFRDAYLQLAYQYRSNPLVYGIGIIVHTGPTLKEAANREFDPAAGALVYLENVGNGLLSGWGVSYTALEIDEQELGASIDASRAELYYAWRF